MPAKPRVAVFLGGPSSEHEVSLKTGSLMLARLDRTRFEPCKVFVDRDRVWHVPDGPDASPVPFRYGTSDALPWRVWKPDLALLGLHGAYGEDGEIQTELAALGIPYTGSGPAASRLAMNKAEAKEVFRGASLPVAPGVVFDGVPLDESGERADVAKREESFRARLSSIAGPWVLKPRDGGS